MLLSPLGTHKLYERVGTGPIPLRVVSSLALPASSQVTTMVLGERLYIIFGGSRSGLEGSTHVMLMTFDSNGHPQIREIQTLAIAPSSLRTFAAADDHFLLASRAQDTLLLRWTGSMFLQTVGVATTAAHAASGQVLTRIKGSVAHFHMGGNDYLVGSADKSRGLLLFARVEHELGLNGPVSVQVIRRIELLFQ